MPLPPNRVAQLIGLAILVGGTAVGVTQGASWWCPALILMTIGGLVFGNQLGGVTRIRVTFSKLLVENERPVMGFLIGPSKKRIGWEEFTGVEVVGDKVVARGKPVDLELAQGEPAADLQELATKIAAAAARYESEKAP
ncbi:MAG: hypothetical protein ABMA64_38995 [Myxococcota bacterium]